MDKATDDIRFPCPCCWYKTFDAEPDGSFDICPVCFWEDDNVQLAKKFCPKSYKRGSKGS